MTGSVDSHEEALMRDKQPCLECARVEARATDTKRLFALGDRVCKTRGSSWNGIIVGFYSTALTPVGYAVESERQPGSVQIYPESALEAAKLPEADGREPPGCPTPGACSCPGGEAELAKRLAAMTKWCRMLTKEVKRLDDMIFHDPQIINADRFVAALTSDEMVEAARAAHEAEKIFGCFSTVAMRAAIHSVAKAIRGVPA